MRVCVKDIGKERGGRVARGHSAGGSTLRTDRETVVDEDLRNNELLEGLVNVF